MPASWVTQIHISEEGNFCMTYSNPSAAGQSCRACWCMQTVFDLWCSLFAFTDMESRFPGGSKVIRYRKATLERFSPYLLKDGLITRLTTFDDLECEFKVKIFMTKNDLNQQMAVFVFSLCLTCTLHLILFFSQTPL